MKNGIIILLFDSTPPRSTDEDSLQYISRRNAAHNGPTPYWRFDENSEIELKFNVDNSDNMMLTVRKKLNAEVLEDVWVNRIKVVVNYTPL